MDKPLLKYRVHEDNYSGDRDVVNRENMIIYSRYGIDRLRDVVSQTNYSEAERTVIMGKLYYRLGLIDKGHAFFKDALSRELNGWAALYLGTGYYRYQGDFADAEKYLLMGKEQMPYRAEFYNNLGCCALQTLGVAGSAPYFAEAARLMLSYYNARHNLERAQKGEPFNPRLTDREIEHSEQFGVVWKQAEKKREESGSLQPAGNL